MAHFVIAHDTSGYDFLINLDNVECFRSEKDGKCSAKLVNGHVIYLNARLTDVQRTLKEAEAEEES